MSRIRADKITNKGANGAPDFPDGLTVTGVITATTLNQTLNGDLTVTGKVSIGGTLTYEDVTNIDSVGVITAREGIRVGAGKSIGSDGAAAVYYGDGSQLTGISAGVSTEYVSTQGLTVVGVSTFNDNIEVNSTNSKRFYLMKSGSDEFSLYDSGGTAYITHKKTSTNLQVQTNHIFKIGSASSPWRTSASFQPSGDVELYSSNDSRFKTNSYGVEIKGNSGSNTDGGRLDISNATTSNWSNNAWARITNEATNGVSQFQFWTQPSGGSLTERFRIGSAGQLGIGGATYGTSGQVLKSAGNAAPPTWGAADGWAEHVYFNKDGDLANCSTNTWAKVAFDAGWHIGTSTGQFSDANDRYTPGVAGWYLINASVICHSNGSNTWWHIEVRKNNSGVSVGHSIYPYQTNGTKFRLACTGLIACDNDDYLEVFVNQSTGGTRGVDDKAWTIVRVGATV